MARQMKADVINPVVEYTSTSTLSDDRPFTLGYEFTTSTNFDINALGYWDDGLGNNHEVGIWNSQGTLLVSTTVLGTDPLTGGFRWDLLSSDFLLVPGTYLIGGEYLGNGNPFPNGASGITALPGYTYVTDEQSQGTGLIFPTFSSGGGYGDNGILAADFSIGSTVPEPSAVALLGSILAVAMYFLRKKIRTV
jgi:hypothetical protein